MFGPQELGHSGSRIHHGFLHVNPLHDSTYTLKSLNPNYLLGQLILLSNSNLVPFLGQTLVITLYIPTPAKNFRPQYSLLVSRLQRFGCYFFE